MKKLVYTLVALLVATGLSFSSAYAKGEKPPKPDKPDKAVVETSHEHGNKPVKSEYSGVYIHTDGGYEEYSSTWTSQIVTNPNGIRFRNYGDGWYSYTDSQGNTYAGWWKTHSHYSDSGYFSVGRGGSSSSLYGDSEYRYVCNMKGCTNWVDGEKIVY